MDVVVAVATEITATIMEPTMAAVDAAMTTAAEAVEAAVVVAVAITTTIKDTPRGVTIIMVGTTTMEAVEAVEIMVTAASKCRTPHTVMLLNVTPIGIIATRMVSTWIMRASIALAPGEITCGTPSATIRVVGAKRTHTKRNFPAGRTPVGVIIDG